MVDDAQERWLLPLLARIGARPGMWLGDERVETLDHYLAGYAQARQDIGQEWMAPSDEALLKELGTWLAERTEPRQAPPALRSLSSWARAVAQIDPGPQSARTFFRLLEEYLNRRGEPLQSVTPMLYRGSPRPDERLDKGGLSEPVKTR